MITKQSNFTVDNRISYGVMNNTKPVVNNEGESALIERTVFLNATEIKGINENTLFLSCTFFEGDFIPNQSCLVDCTVLPISEKDKFQRIVTK